MAVVQEERHVTDVARAEQPHGAALTGVEHLWEVLHDVEDPEFPMSIVDMGLVLDISRGGGTVHVKMTFTAMGCPCIDMIMEDVRARLRQEPKVEQVEIEVVWSPPWNKSRLTERGREIMLMSGVSI